MLCPVCATKQIENQLIFYQINFEEAVYLCENRQCTYPEDHDWVFVKRNWLDINKKDLPCVTEHRSTTELDQWFNKMLAEDGNKNPDFDGDFDLDELEKILMGDGDDQNEESALQEMVEPRINVLSNVQVQAPQSKLSVEVEQEKRAKEASKKSDSGFPADLFEALCVNDSEICKNGANRDEIKNLNNTQTCKPTEKSKEASKSSEDCKKVINFQNKDDFAMANKAVVDTLKDNEIAQSNINEQSTLRRSSRVRKSTTNVALPSIEKPTKQVRPKTLQCTNMTKQAATFKLSSEFVEKITLDEEQRFKKREHARQQSKPVLNKEVLNYLQSLPHSK